MHQTDDVTDSEYDWDLCPSCEETTDDPKTEKGDKRGKEDEWHQKETKERGWRRKKEVKDYPEK